ncbi:MAG: helix-turn-helix domain-containing protein [Chloroflexia bacterium]
MASLGERIRALRLERKMTLQEVSAGADLTPSFLSRLERDRVNISVANLRKIASFFGVPVTYFFSSEEVPSLEIVRSEERRTLEVREEGLRLRGLLPDGEHHAGAVEAIVAPGGKSSRRAPRDGQVLVYVIWGRLRFWADGESHELGSGDALLLRDGTLYGWENTGSEDAHFILIQPLGFGRREPI